ncbi:acylneuraminate cytidylyltransferase family protein [Pseudomonas sp. PhalM4]
MSVSCFLPCRKGSERVPRKNIKKFSNFEFGLIEVKLKQLKHCELIDEIVLSTNDEEIIEFASSFDCDKLKIHKRENSLSSSSTSTDDLVALAEQITSEEHILWTHVTSPFYGSESYSRAIKDYFDGLNNGYDSLMSVKEIHGFLWDEQSPLNYDRNVEKWPRTQTLKPIYEVDSAVFMLSREGYLKHRDRIGTHPRLHVTNQLEGFDIDWPDDFTLAEAMIKSGVATA